MSPSADVLALASAEFDVSAVPMGNTITVKWRGKPIFIRHRTAAEIAKEAEVDITTLRDPETDLSRALDPAWCVICSPPYMCTVYNVVYIIMYQ